MHPGIESGAQGLALVLDGEVDQSGGAAESGGARASFKIVRTGGAAEGHVEMGVDIDSAREHILVFRVENARRVLARQILADGGDLAAGDGDVSGVGIGGGDDGAVYDECVKTHVVSNPKLAFGTALTSAPARFFQVRAALPPAF